MAAWVLRPLAWASRRARYRKAIVPLGAAIPAALLIWLLLLLAKTVAGIAIFACSRGPDEAKCIQARMGEVRLPYLAAGAFVLVLAALVGLLVAAAPAMALAATRRHARVREAQDRLSRLEDLYARNLVSAATYHGMLGPLHTRIHHDPPGAVGAEERRLAWTLLLVGAPLAFVPLAGLATLAEERWNGTTEPLLPGVAPVILVAWLALVALLVWSVVAMRGAPAAAASEEADHARAWSALLEESRSAASGGRS